MTEYKCPDCGMAVAERMGIYGLERELRGALAELAEHKKLTTKAGFVLEATPGSVGEYVTKLEAEVAALREERNKSWETHKVLTQSMARTERDLAQARALLDEARKWLVNFPKHEAPSNIRCWKIGVGTFVERLRAFLDPRRDEVGALIDEAHRVHAESMESLAGDGDEARRCASCDEPWPHPGKLCEPRDEEHLP